MNGISIRYVYPNSLTRNPRRIYCFDTSKISIEDVKIFSEMIQGVSRCRK